VILQSVKPISIPRSSRRRTSKSLALCGVYGEKLTALCGVYDEKRVFTGNASLLQVSAATKDKEWM